MVTILPLKNKTRVEKVLSTVKDAEDNFNVLVMCEDDKELGYVAFDMKSSVIRMLKMEVYGCPNLSSASGSWLTYADSLVKASASYGSTIGAYKIESRIKSLKEYLLTLGFNFSDGKLLSPLSNFVKFCKH